MANAVKKSSTQPKGHGGGVRGDNSTPSSSSFEGRFGRMFRSLPAAKWEKDALMKLVKEMTAPPELDANGLPNASSEDPKKRIQDDEENAGIPAGYTYLGQFIDHDITFDPASSLQQQNDPDALIDFRTPRLDLDSLYGRGPDDQPYMYDENKFRLGRPLFEGTQPKKVRDLPRFNDPFLDPRIDPLDPRAAKRALIGDKRNDENVIVSQLHAAMLQFHNKLVDANPKETLFAEIQRQVRWHYQWIVVNDFLFKICGETVVKEILPHLGKNEPIWKNPPKLAFYHPEKDAFMPVEFSVAAYRFGHSMVRPIYRLNTQLQGGENPAATPAEKKRGIDGRFFIFAGVHNRGLNGFGEFPEQWAIDWSLFFDINGSIGNVGQTRVQPAYKIDTSLTNPLGFLPEFSKPALAAQGDLTLDKLQAVAADPDKAPANLAQRNLFRGLTMGLPSGQDVARAMGVKVVEDENLRLGKAVLADWDKNKPLTSIDDSFKENAPLWYYVLAETQWEWVKRAKASGKGDETPLTLGPVGARIVAETLIGMLWEDGHSYLRQAPNWRPAASLQTMGGLLDWVLK